MMGAEEVLSLWAARMVVVVVAVVVVVLQWWKHTLCLTSQAPPPPLWPFESGSSSGSNGNSSDVHLCRATYFDIKLEN